MMLSRDYIADSVLMSKGLATKLKIDTLCNVFDELHTLSHFSVEREIDSKKLGVLDAKANRLRKELLDVLDELGASGNLIRELKQPIATLRMKDLHKNHTERYIQDLLDAGFIKDDINRIYLPAIKRFNKLPQKDPFNIL